MAKLLRQKYRVDPATSPAFECGSYVRAVGRDMGTGQITEITEATILNQKTRKLDYLRSYTVHWLDMNDGNLEERLPEADLVQSARGVPKFDTPEEAQAWLERQAQPGNWVDKVQDAADSHSDMDIALRKLLDGDD